MVNERRGQNETVSWNERVGKRQQRKKERICKYSVSGVRC